MKIMKTKQQMQGLIEAKIANGIPCLGTSNLGAQIN